MKISKYTTVLRKEGTYLLHNTMYNSVMKVHSVCLQNFIDTIMDGKSFDINQEDAFHKTLQSLNMIVSETENELSTLNSRFFMFEHSSELYVMLIVTRRCNFRCVYCYEDYNNSDMSKEVFDNTRAFIIQQIKEYNYKNIYISFFGGEPTLMANEINEFMETLLAENEKLVFPAYIRAIITTNGYLLSEEMIKRFVKNNIIRYQITVDGLEQDHNSSRYLINKQGTWRRIIKNLEFFNHVSEPNVSVLLRSNVTPDIYEHIDEWLAFIHKNFASPIFKIHFEVAKDFGRMNDKNYKLLTNEVDVIMDIVERAKKWKLPLELVGFNTLPFSMICYAARQFSFIVDCDGDIKKCTSASLDEPYNNIGKICKEGMSIDWKKAAQWTSYELSEKCKNCNILPLCYQRKCPVARDSYDTCELLKSSYIKGLEYFYF